MSESVELNHFVEDDRSWVPRVDMEFETDEDAYKFYNNYAKEVGFSVRKAWINRRASGVIISRTYVCYKEGYQGNKKDESEVKKPRINERTGCLAHMTIKITVNGRYRVSEFHPMHNHEFVAKAHMLKSHRVVIRPVAARKATNMEGQAGGHRSLNLTSVEDAADKSWAPKVDMEFDNDEKAYQFYNNYAKEIGFSVRKAWVNRRSSGVIISRTYVCYKEGYYGNKKDESQVQLHRLRPNERTGCLARMTIKIAKNGRYRVNEFQPMHNHEFVTPTRVHILKSYRLSTETQADVADLPHDSGMSPKATYEYLGGQARAPRCVTFLSIKNYLPSKRKDALKLGDVGAVMQYMQERQADDPSFYYAMQLDEEDQMTNIFWADAKSMVDYHYFGDVVCFDTTYKTNDCGRPFAPLFGVNHHKQMVIFGAALLYDDTEESFKWLFETFKTAMCGKQPEVILTDQNVSMSNAIVAVWPGTIHRICVWHMHNNAAKHLSQVFQGSKTFANDFSRCIYDCDEEEEFVSAWRKMLEKYDLEGNGWMDKLFEDREKWALAYGRETFCADMKSTQCTETLNNSLKNYLSLEQDLLHFLRHYERVVDERRFVELQADFYASQSTPTIAPSRMLRQAANAYTPAVFEIFQQEFEMSMDCMVYSCGAVGATFEYKVTVEENLKEHLVRFDSSDGTLVCSCKRFEFTGIQCRHVLKVLDNLNIKELPPKYILKRWRKDAKVGPVRDNCEFASDIDTISSNATRYSSLCHIFSRIAARGAETVEAYTFIENQSDHLMDHVYQFLRTRPPEKPQYS